MDILKIVCNHYDSKVVKSAQIIIEQNNLFKRKIQLINSELCKIVKAIRCPQNTLELSIIQPELNSNEREKILKENLLTRTKYSALFKNISESNVECIYNESKLLGVIGTIDILEKIYTLSFNKDETIIDNHINSLLNLNFSN